MHVIEQPIPPAPAADSQANVLAEWNALYDAHNEEVRSMFKKQARVERFNLIQTFHACKQKEGKLVGAYVLKMKDYVEQLKRLGYVLPQDLSVGLILNGLTNNFTGFGLPKKTETPQVMMNKGGKIQKSNKKSLKAKDKGKANGKGKDKQVYISKPKNLKPAAKKNPTKDDTCHHCKEVGHWKRNCHVYLAELLKKKKQVGISSSLITFVLQNRGLENNGIYEIDMHDLVPNVNSIYNVSTKRAKHNLNSIYLWHCRIAHISKKRIEKLQHEGLLKSTDDESFDQCVSCLSGKIARKSFPHRPERATDILGIIHTDVCGPLRHVSRQEVSGRAIDLEEIQNEDTSPSEITSKIPIEVEGFKPPQEEVIPIRSLTCKSILPPWKQARKIYYWDLTSGIKTCEELLKRRIYRSDLKPFLTNFNEKPNLISLSKMSDHEDETINEENAPPKVVPQITTVTNISTKFPYLKKGEYDIWAMKMQNSISSSDLLCWNIILKGNSAKSMTTDNDGNMKILPPVTAEEHQQVQREEKARTILLFALPDEHMGDFYHMIDASDIWNAIKVRFDGNAESKKMQKSLLKQKFEEFKVSE
uniref:Zinc finger, CCHC-type n=1 Tax=Tanacetum cinerariifolium TaxID=118510 RepID=A0A699GXY6_TANCI|nr:zinc finger, CCHC-type [Tanacetum cinerariifolium]